MAIGTIRAALHKVAVRSPPPRRLDNTGGRLQSGGDLGLDTVGNILNRTGKLTAQQALDIRGGDTGLFDNDGGSLQSGGDLSLQGGQLTNRAAGWCWAAVRFLTLTGAGTTKTVP